MTDVNIGRVLANRYRIDSLLADGEVMRLYRGTNTVVQRPVTIKILAPELNELQKTVLDEARDVSRLSSPNILSVSDLGTETGGTVYVVYEGFDGETLSSAMDRDGKMPVFEAIDIARQIAEGSAAVSTARQAHGFVSPHNVLTTDPFAGPRRVKLFNFFPSGTFHQENGDGVPSDFLAPEVISSGPADERSDVYSLGVILFTMLAGEKPFSGDLPDKSFEEPPPPLSSFRSDLPPNLEPVVLTAMAKNPEMRYQTLSEFAQHLEQVASPVISTSPATATNNNLWKTAFIVLAGIAILSAALIYATSVKQTDPKTQLQPDANGQPVQPINPATGAQEQALANMAGMPSEVLANSNMAIPPGTLPGGDGFDAWKNGGKPPPGAPNVGPGGQVITIDPNNPSQFMPNEGGIILVPVPANTTVKPTPTPRNAANTGGQPSPTPKGAPETRPTPERSPAKPATQKTPAPAAKPSPGKPGDVE